jgi:uncharacterized protein with PQ loop repeat
MINIGIIGWVGTILLAICGFPQMIKSIREGHSEGISHAFLWLWFWGEVFYIIYVLFKDFDTIQLSNYILNIAIVIVLIYYKYFPRKTNEKTN